MSNGKSELESRSFLDHASGNIQKDRLMPWKSSVPSVDIEDQGKAFVLTIDLPGFRKADVTLEVTKDCVVIQACKQDSKEVKDKNRNYIRKERVSQGYYRRVSLPQEIDSDQAQASLMDGVLQITLPKKERFEKKRIVIT